MLIWRRRCRRRVDLSNLPRSFRFFSYLNYFTILILENVIYAPKCEHAFCSDCIHEWLANQQTCPLDRTPLQKEELNSVPRIMKNMLGKLRWVLRLIWSGQMGALSAIGTLTFCPAGHCMFSQLDNLKLEFPQFKNYIIRESSMFSTGFFVCIVLKPNQIFYFFYAKK